MIVKLWNLPYNEAVDTGCRAAKGVGLKPLYCWVCGFECRWGHWYTSLLFIVCCESSGLCYELITCSGVFPGVCVSNGVWYRNFDTLWRQVGLLYIYIYILRHAVTCLGTAIVQSVEWLGYGLRNKWIIARFAVGARVFFSRPFRPCVRWVPGTVSPPPHASMACIATILHAPLCTFTFLVLCSVFYLRTEQYFGFAVDSVFCLDACRCINVIVICWFTCHAYFPWICLHWLGVVWSGMSCISVVGCCSRLRNVFLPRKLGNRRQVYKKVYQPSRNMTMSLL
jgi:hypothetical protein